MIKANDLWSLMAQADIDVEASEANTEKTFSELGLDSLDVFNFFVEVDTEYGVVVADDEFEALNTLEKVAQRINQSSAA
ncbi:acyl carrier protein [Marinomonas ostreistagni]|uniref:acyl carrier protein n=1 Tax=Marinomonas ostreistagni TaxID=359209 RepID=UPI00195083D4|nr:phosphopantetheine-binding protein [Marinomonas ostreistagni]MBM6551156.1 acyl carrier protein [Marinomonas ostreistagni]